MKEGGEWYCECVLQREEKRVREWHNLGERERERYCRVCCFWFSI